MTSALQFDPVTHRYTANGRRVRSVTQALYAAGLVDFSWCTEFARWRGSAVHQAIHLELTTGLDWSSLPESFHPFVNAATEYLRDHHALVIETERRVYSPTYNYAGTLDVIFREHSTCGVKCMAPSKGRVIITDWKSGAPVKATALQLAAYAHAYYEETGTLLQERRAVHVKASGEYQATTYTDRADRNRFIAALTVAELRCEYGLHTDEGEVAA